MKLIESTTTIEQIGNITEENTFRMKSSRKAFQILSDLYSDKPLAIVRELGCNASDSMVVAGKANQPFHIHLPTTLEPWLTIQDYGTGINHDDIYNIYAVYFESTKTNSDNQIGCLGLGSKSPFCYTDNFTITSITNGIKRIYNAFFNQQATPAIALLSTENTNEQNGIAIQIPIKPNDFNLFHRAVQKSFRFFDVKPTITGASIDWANDTATIKGNKWSVYQKFEYNENYAIMGGVVYPIDINKLDAKYSNVMRRGGFVLFFGMGDIDFAPSREHLSYCDTTIKALNDKMEFVLKEIKVRMNEMLAEKENIYDALMMVNTIHETFANNTGITIEELDWKGRKIQYPTEYIKEILKHTDSSKKGLIKTYRKNSYYKRKINENTGVAFTKDTTWYYDDNSKAILPRLKAEMNSNPDKPYTIIPMDCYKIMLADGFPASCFQPASNIPKVVRNKSNKTNSNLGKTKVKGVFNLYYIGETDKVSWEGYSFDSSNNEEVYPKYYILKSPTNWEFSFKIKGLNTLINNKEKLKKVMRFYGISTDDIVMVSQNNIKYLPSECDKLEDYFNQNEINFDDIQLEDINHYNQGTISNYHKKLEKVLDADHPFMEFLNKVQSNWDKFGKYQSIQNMFDYKRDVENITTIDDEVLQLFVRRMGQYQWDADTYAKIIPAIKINKKPIDTNDAIV
jgi:hypothetical protein